MDPFYCLIHTPEAITPELCLLAARTETAGLPELRSIAQEWPRLERLELYRGDARLGTFTLADIIATAWMQAA